MNQNHPQALPIIRARNFGHDFIKYISGFAEIHNAFQIPKYTVGDTDIAYRVISHWDEYGLLPAGFKKDGGWREFSLVEMAWLRIISRLREFGMSLEQIKKAKDGIIAWDLEKKQYQLFEYFLASAVASNMNAYAVVDKDGRGSLGTEYEIEIFKFAHNDPDLILISLKGIMRELGFQIAPAKMSSDSDTDMANDVSGNVKEIKIGQKKSGVKEIETTEVHPAESISDIQKRLHDSGAFGEMTIKYENGKEQSAEVKVRKRINK